MGSRKNVRPTPPPSGPALVRPAIGVLLVTLGGAADVGCKQHNPPMAHPGDPPMAVPDDSYGPPPMPPPPMPDPGDPPMQGPVDAPPVDQPPIAPMPPPMPGPPPMPNPGKAGSGSPE